MDMSLVLSIASLILWAFSFIYFRSFLTKRTSKERILGEFRDEVERMIADVDAATDRDIALIEDRVKSLRTLLEETDKHIIAYKKEINRRTLEEQAYAELGRRQSRTVIKSGIPPEPTTQDTEFRDKISTDAGSQPRFNRSESELKPKAPSFSEQVLELYQAGFSPELIASKLKVTVAEVDLAINVSGKNRNIEQT